MSAVAKPWTVTYMDAEGLLVTVRVTATGFITAGGAADRQLADKGRYADGMEIVALRRDDLA